MTDTASLDPVEPSRERVQADSGSAEPAPADPLHAQYAGPVRPATAVSSRAGLALTLLSDPTRIAELRNAPIIKEHARSNGTVRHVKTIYYDTPDGALFDVGVTLHVRQSGERYTQALRIPEPDPENPDSFRDWEVTVPDMAPELSSLRSLIPDALQPALPSQPLRPIFATKLRRHTRTLVFPAAQIDVIFNEGLIEAGERASPVSDIELRLRQGSPAVLYDLALRLNEAGSVRPSLFRVAERGFSLAFNEPPRIQRFGRLEFPPDCSFDDALAVMLRSSLHHLLANQAVAEDGRDPEGVHQLRIALRRLRAVLGLLRAVAPSATLEAFRADARWTASNLGDARMWDVFIADLLPDVAHGCVAIEGFPVLGKQAEAERAAGYLRTRRALGEVRCSRFQIALSAWIAQRGWRTDAAREGLLTLTEPARDVAARILEQRHRKTLKKGRHFRHLSPDARHEVRLAIKQLRYVVDLFIPLLGEPKSFKRYARRLHNLQDHLGAYNDIRSTTHLTDRLAAESMPNTAHQALGAVIGWQAHRLGCVEVDLRSAWRAYRHTALPWPAEESADAPG